MRRIHFVELHEQPWFPSSIRDEVTDALQFGLNILKAYAPIAPLLQTALDATRSPSIVDLCSGGGGPWLDLSQKLHRNAEHFDILLTDKYPNLGASELVKEASGNHLLFHPDPVDPRNVPGELTGFRTMFSSFHHFPRDQARAILQNAIDARQGIGIFEITRRTPSAIGLMFPWAFTALLFTPWIRPFRWSRLFWTYVIPLIPFVLLFDGVVSCIRTYTPKELREIVDELAAIEYRWEFGEHSRAAAQVPITYLIGYPLPHLRSEVSETTTSEKSLAP
ncbi:MAG TPA: hypothetical protein VN788_09370 [Verrucomicrobiae bacterium]|nr:hypothetical protein [Verrucomicrobiae bacterium]